QPVGPEGREAGQRQTGGQHVEKQQGTGPQLAAPVRIHRPDPFRPPDQVARPASLRRSASSTPARPRQPTPSRIHGCEAGGAVPPAPVATPPTGTAVTSTVTVTPTRPPPQRRLIW